MAKPIGNGTRVKTQSEWKVGTLNKKVCFLWHPLPTDEGVAKEELMDRFNEYEAGSKLTVRFNAERGMWEEVSHKLFFSVHDMDVTEIAE